MKTTGVSLGGLGGVNGGTQDLGNLAMKKKFLFGGRRTLNDKVEPNPPTPKPLGLLPITALG